MVSTPKKPPTNSDERFRSGVPDVQEYFLHVLAQEEERLSGTLKPDERPIATLERCLLPRYEHYCTVAERWQRLRMRQLVRADEKRITDWIKKAHPRRKVIAAERRLSALRQRQPVKKRAARDFEDQARMDAFVVMCARQSLWLPQAVKAWAGRFHLVTKDGEPPASLIDTIESTLLTWRSDPSLKCQIWCAGESFAKPKRRRSLPPDQYFRWAVGYQVFNISVSKLLRTERAAHAKEKYNYKYNRTLIEYGINEILQSIGIVRRPSRMGRPSKV